MKQNALDFAVDYPQAANGVEKSFHIDDDLTGADSMEKVIELQQELQELFAQGGASYFTSGTQVYQVSCSASLQNSENPSPCTCFLVTRITPKLLDLNEMPTSTTFV